MANLKSFDSNSQVDGGSTKRARIIGGAATAAVTAVLALMFVLDFNGCSNEKKSAAASSGSQNKLSASSPAPTPAVQPASSLESKVEAVIQKKKPVKRITAATYKNSAYGVSFRYPRSYTMMTADKAGKDATWPDPVAMNFTEDGGETLATLVLTGTRSSSYFRVNVNKNLDAERCGKFATTPEPYQPAANPPADPSEDSIVPVKTNVLGVEFARAESVTDLSEARYYHRFENGACYEFALGVEDSPNTARPVDHLRIFDQLERIMTTVKIQSEPMPAVAASEPVPQPTPASNPQQ
jgi:hypothetical protein